MWIETPQTAITAIHIHGGQEAIGSAKGRLEAAGFRLSPTGGHSILLENILIGDLSEIESVAAEHNLVLEALGEKEVTTREAAPKAFKLNLEPGKWYWADNLEDTTPLIFVKDVEATADAQVLTLEYLAPEGLPVPVTIDSREVVEYGFRPATTDDFERYDLIAPDHTYLVPRTAEVKEVAPAKPKSANKENFKRRQKKVMTKKLADRNKIKLTRQEKKWLLTDAKEAITLAQDLVGDVLKFGGVQEMETALDHLYEALKIVSDSIPRGK